MQPAATRTPSTSQREAVAALFPPHQDAIAHNAILRHAHAQQALHSWLRVHMPFWMEHLPTWDAYLTFLACFGPHRTSVHVTDPRTPMGVLSLHPHDPSLAPAPEIGTLRLFVASAQMDDRPAQPWTAHRSLAFARDAQQALEGLDVALAPLDGLAPGCVWWLPLRVRRDLHAVDLRGVVHVRDQRPDGGHVWKKKDVQDQMGQFSNDVADPVLAFLIHTLPRFTAQVGTFAPIT